MRDDHRKFTSTTSFIPQRIDIPFSIEGLHLFCFGYTALYTSQSDSYFKGGDPAAGSPTATLLRLLPRC